MISGCIALRIGKAKSLSLIWQMMWLRQIIDEFFNKDDTETYLAYDKH